MDIVKKFDAAIEKCYTIDTALAKTPGDAYAFRTTFLPHTPSADDNRLN